MNLSEIDFNELYIKQKKLTSFKPKLKTDWDKKAKSMNIKIHDSIYNDELLSKINFDGCNTFLDVGCGVGNISIKVAKKVQKVYALDFSDTMLDYLSKNAKVNDIKNIEAANYSFNDNWQSIPKCDIVLASRSLEVDDMKSALKKLNEKANKRVYVTYKVGGSFVDKDILKAIDKHIYDKPDYIYLINILYSMGINATVEFIKSESRNNIYDTKEKFIKSIQWSLEDLSQEQLEKLEKYYENLDKDTKINQAYNYWALLSWDI